MAKEHKSPLRVRAIYGPRNSRELKLWFSFFQKSSNTFLKIGSSKAI